MSDKEFVYSLNGEDFNHDEFDEAVIDQLQDMDLSMLEAGQRCHIYKGVKFASKPSVQIDIDDLDDLIENLKCRADDIGGEYADDWSYDIEYKKKDLLNVICKWLDENVPFNFYGVTDIEPVHFTITQEMIDEVTQ